MHRLLERQVKRYLGEYAALSPELRDFLIKVDEAYSSADMDRALIERSLDLMSKELTERNAELRSELKVRQLAESQLEDLLFLLSSTLEATVDGILVLGQDGKVMRFNKRFVEMWRIPDEIIAFWNSETLIHYMKEQVVDGDNLVEKLNLLSRYASGELSETFICTDQRVIECNSRSHGHENDKAVRVLSFRDITRRKLAENALLQEKEEQKVLIRKLEDTKTVMLQSEKMASIGQLAAGVAHEINNPIGFVYSNLGVLEKYVQDLLQMLEVYEMAEQEIASEEVKSGLRDTRIKLDIEYLKEDLHSLMKESKDGIVRVKNIVQNLKDFSHADAGEEWQLADLHAGLNSTLNIVNNEIKYRAEVRKEYAEIPDIECLPSQLNQVFMNLLVNASHAIEDRGLITVRTGQQGGGVWVEVEDTGKGISPDNLPKIFDPFFTTKPIGKGTGLGLSLSYGIVQKHNGHIDVQSIEGKGTTFRVWLPIRHVPREEI